jgi:polar amino acid transport system substrate-binding protein
MTLNIFSNQPLEIICDKWPPYKKEEKGFISGFSTEVIRSVLNKMDVPIHTIKAYPWKRAIIMLKNASVDGLFSINYTFERSEYAWYPDEPIIESPWLIWGTSNSKYEDFSSLDEKKIGIVRGYSYTEKFLDYIYLHCKVEEAADDLTNFKKLKDGKIDFTPADFGNGIYLLRHYNLINIKPFKNNPIKKDGLYLVFNKNRISEKFTKDFSENLKEFKKTKLYGKLFNKYFALPDNYF